MQEYVSEAIVLRIGPRREADGAVVLFTRRFGKVAARLRSVRKITSKLAGHLQPGNVVAVRLIEKHGLQAVDAVKKRSLEIAPADLNFLERLLPEFEADPELWASVAKDGIRWRGVLAHLGWDPERGHCAGCRAGLAEAFATETQEFFCAACASKLRPDEVIYILRE